MTETVSPGEVAIDQLLSKLNLEKEKLSLKAKRLLAYHQFFTIATILFGVSAPAIVSVTASQDNIVWKILAIVITAFATAASTIRSVLRFADRYKNASLTAISISHLYTQLDEKKNDAKLIVKKVMLQQRLFSYSTWAQQEYFKIEKAYIDQDINSLSQESIKLSEPPKIQEDEKE